MIRLTLGMIRSSSFPESVGICASDVSRVANYVNECQERLINDPMAPDEGWWGGWARMQFTVSLTNRYAYITTPHDIARVIVLTVCDKPIRIRNGFYEFLQFGAGLQPKSSSCVYGSSVQACECNTTMQAYERDTVVTLTDQTISPATLRFYPTSSSDVGKRILVQGVDQNGQVIYGVDIETKAAILGEYVNLTLPYVDTANQFTQITGFLKAQTVDQVQIFQVDPDTGDQLELSSMAPTEVTAQYRKYLLNGLPTRCCNSSSGTVQVTGQVKFDYVPVQSDPDYVLIQSLPALIEEAQSIKYSRIDSPKAPELEMKHHAKALALLNGQLDHYLGKTQTAIKVPIFGSNRARLQPI